MWIGFQQTEFRIPKAPKPGFSIAHTNISLIVWDEMIKLNAVVQGGYASFICRWFTINVAYVSFIRKTISMTNQGPNPPPVLRLSDGGHIENLGILPLLKLRLEKIVAVNGGRTIRDEDYGSTLLAGLDMARKKLGCSFSGMDGRDITEDIRDNFVDKPPGSQPSSYR